MMFSMCFQLTMRLIHIILSSTLLLAVNARVMLTRNCDVKDSLVNGVMGYIFHFVNGKDNDVSAVAVIFDNKNVGKKNERRKQTGNMVLIERIQEEILIKKSTTIVRHQFPLKLAWGAQHIRFRG